MDFFIAGKGNLKYMLPPNTFIKLGGCIWKVR
nr:MAG TPA: hypothetical protein [Caudoviricetes sp.]